MRSVKRFGSKRIIGARSRRARVQQLGWIGFENLDCHRESDRRSTLGQWRDVARGRCRTVLRGERLSSAIVAFF
jgi:hypothetical protein